MNQRIQELKNQCWVEKRWDKDNERWIEKHVDLEKFAKLIVQECMDIAYEYDAPKMSGPGIIIANRIESYFGVEE